MCTVAVMAAAMSPSCAPADGSNVAPGSVMHLVAIALENRLLTFIQIITRCGTDEVVEVCSIAGNE